MTSLSGKVAIVTGASSGIGRAAAVLFAREGAEVIVTARRRSALEELVAEIADAGGTAVAHAGDVRDEAGAKALVAMAVERFGGLDIAFNNAGTLGEMGPAADITLEGWRDTLDTNLTGAFIGAQHQLHAMIARGGGSLIFTSTFVGHTAGMPGMAAYAASKAGLIGLTQVLAAEVRGGRHPGKRDPARRHRHADGPHRRRYAGGNHLRREFACVEAHRNARGNRPIRALSGVGRIELHDRHGDVG